MRIKVDNITVSYLDKKNVNTVLKDYSLKIPTDKITAVLGASGSGKTTLLNVIAGLITPEAGHIYFDDKEVTFLPPNKRNIGYVFQNSGLYPYLNVRKNILFPLINKNMPKNEKFQLVNDIAKTLGVVDLLERKPGELSGGETRRVALARAMIKSPKLLLLDEPFSALDEENKIKAMDFLKHIKNLYKITVIFVTHDLDEANYLADNIVSLK